MDRDKLKKLIALVEKHGLTELTVEEEGFSVTIKAEDGPPSAAAASRVRQTAYTADPAQVETGVSAPGEEVPEEYLYEIESPMIGVFYRCSSADSPPYLEVGDLVEGGQTVGLIEAMKVFSEVPAEHGGRVIALPAENGKLVQQGDLLVVIDTSATE